MKRSYSWLSAFCRYAGLLIDEEPILPIHTPVSINSDTGSGAKSPVGFPLEGLIMIEDGKGGSSVYVHMGSHVRQRQGTIQHA